MRLNVNPVTRAGEFLLLGALFVCQHVPAQTLTLTNVNVRIMAANITSGNFSSYEWPGINIFKGLKPDVVAIQEFKYNNSTSAAQLRQLVDTAFGTNFHYFRENYTAGGDIPNGIISRWPILDSGSWDDPLLANRGFAWAKIDLPGTNDLYVVSVHLYSNGTATDRNTEATVVKTNIQGSFPANAWVIVGGDFNTVNRSEAAVATFKTFLSDNPIPTDAETGGNANTNEDRDNPYDYLLPSFSLTNSLTNVVIGTHTFPKGLVFDSDVYSPLSEVAPVIITDSHTNMMQHMAVVKDFRISYYVTNSGIAPVITNAPQDLTVVQSSNATFTVVVGGTVPLNYQWRFSTTNIAGATASTYTRTNAQPAHAGNYFVVITNTVGAVTSAPAALTVNVPPSLTTSPTNQTLAQAAPAIFYAAATGSPTPAYQWRFNATNLGGATGSSFTRTSAQPADMGEYFVVVTNAAGSVTSAPATLKLIVPTPNLAMSAANTLQFQGLSNLNYTVQMKTNLNDSNWIVAGTATSPTGIIFFTNTATAPHQFYRVVYP